MKKVIIYEIFNIDKNFKNFKFLQNFKISNFFIFYKKLKIKSLECLSRNKQILIPNGLKSMNKISIEKQADGYLKLTLISIS